jgi:hypothetical protein
MPVPYNPRRPKPPAVPTEAEVAQAVAPKADDPAPTADPSPRRWGKRPVEPTPAEE